MRIAILADPLDNQNAGIHVYTREMVGAMIRNNPGHELILIREKKDERLSGVEQIAIFNTRLPIGFASLRLFFVVPWILCRKKVDVVIEPAHFGPFNLPGKIKRITVIHDLTPILFPQLHRWHSQILQKIFLKGILNKAHCIIANSDHTAKDICKVYPENCNKVKRIYPGANSNYKPNVNTGVLEKYGITQPYFLFVGTIEPRKNLLTLLESFRLFKQRSKSDVKLVIAGGVGWKSETFFRALNSHPFKEEIIVTGFANTDDLPALYTKAIALIYPSQYEGFGLPVLEAMSCGTPVIAANNSSLPEAGGKVASYFETNDAADLCNKMTVHATDSGLREKLYVEMQAHIKNFNWDKFAVEFWKTLDEL